MGGWVGGRRYLWVHASVGLEDSSQSVLSFSFSPKEDVPGKGAVDVSGEGWVGGWVGGWGRGDQGGWNEVLWVAGGWVGGGEEGGWNEVLEAMGGWVGGWVGGTAYRSIVSKMLSRTPSSVFPSPSCLMHMSV